MTKRENTYLERLKARRSVLAAELAICGDIAPQKLRESLESEIRKEFDAIKWAIERLERV
jgi:hypothetical protein